MAVCSLRAPTFLIKPNLILSCSIHNFKQTEIKIMLIGWPVLEIWSDMITNGQAKREITILPLLRESHTHILYGLDRIWTTFIDINETVKIKITHYPTGSLKLSMPSPHLLPGHCPTILFSKLALHPTRAFCRLFLLSDLYFNHWLMHTALKSC